MHFASLHTHRTALVGVLLALGGIALLALKQAPIEIRLALWAGWLLAAALAGRGWVADLAGPLFFYDLVGTSRRGRTIILRFLYGLSLLLVLYVLYLNWFGEYLLDFQDLFKPAALPRERVPRFAESFFNTFLVVQLLAVVLLTPAYAAGAIAEERERRTLDFLLTTDLTPREIVLGKLFSRLSSMALLVLAGLPVLSLTVFLGGIDPMRVIIDFVCTFVLMLSIGSLGLMISAASRRTLNAVLGTYALVLGFLGCCPFTGPLFCMHPLFQIYGGSDLGTDMPLDRWFMLAGFVISHLSISIVCLISAVEGLRGLPRRDWTAAPPRLVRPEPVTEIVLRPAAGQVEAQAKPALEPLPLPRFEQPMPHPPVGDRPMLWKELHTEPILGLADMGASINGLSMVLLGVLAIILLVAALAYAEMQQRWPSLGLYLNTLLRPIQAALATLFCLGVGIAAACAVSRERERQTLEGLLTTPLETGEILLAKLLGAGYAFRGLAWNLVMIWFFGAVTGGFHLAALALLLLAWLVQAACFAALGLWLSTVCNSTGRALLLTILVSLVILIGPWVLAGQFDRLLAGLGAPQETIFFINDVLELGLSPPVADYQLGFALEDGDVQSLLPALLTGLLLTVLLAWALWTSARIRLDAERLTR